MQCQKGNACSSAFIIFSQEISNKKNWLKYNLGKLYRSRKSEIKRGTSFSYFSEELSTKEAGLISILYYSPACSTNLYACIISLLKTSTHPQRYIWNFRNKTLSQRLIIFSRFLSKFSAQAFVVR